MLKRPEFISDLFHEILVLLVLIAGMDDDLVNQIDAVLGLFFGRRLDAVLKGGQGEVESVIDD